MARQRRSWQLLVTAVVLVLTLAVPAPAAAASLILDPTFGHPGDLVQARGASFSPVGAPISVQWDGALVASGTVTGRTFTIPFTVPASAAPGPHTVRMCVTGSGPTGCDLSRSDTAVFTVTLVAVTPPPSTPPPTVVPTPVPSPTTTPSPEPTLPAATFPLGGETPTPAPPPVAVVTPAPTPPSGAAVPDEAFPDLWLKAIEVTQGIQDLRNRMPLVEARRTYARVYVGVIGQPDWANVHGALEGRRNGQSLGWIWAENGPITAKLGAGSRVVVDDTLNFRLPQAWLHGEVTLTAFAYSYQVKTVFEDEPQWANNVRSETVVFHPANPLTVHLAPLHLHRSFHPDDVERTYDPDLDADLLPPGGSATLRAVYGLYRLHPLAQVNVDLFTAPVTPLGHGDGHEFNLGGCQTTLLDHVASNHLVIADWEPLMEDPAAIDPADGSSFEPDRNTLRYLDREFVITDWYLSDDGVEVWGISTNIGPIPLPATPVFVGGCHPEPGVSHEANQTLALYRVFYDWDDEEDLFVGMVHPSLPTHFGGQSTGGTDAVWVRMRDTFGSSSAWAHTAAETLAHEAAHAAGLHHVPCSDGDEDGEPDELAGGAIDPSHPNSLTFPFCSLADVDPEGYYGFDVYWSLFGLSAPTVISNNPSQAAPNRGFPWMSYRGPGWADPYHYCRLLDFYGVPCDPTDLGIPWSEPDAPAGGPLTAGPDPTHDDLPPGATGLVGFRGSLDPAAGTGKLEIDYITDAPTASVMRRYSGQYVMTGVQHRLVVLDAAGVELASVPVQQQDASHLDNDTISFDIVVPLYADAHTYQLRSTDHEFVRLEVSPNAPTVLWEPITLETDPTGRVKVRLPWLGGDADGDVLTYTLLYAPDGEHWQVLAAGTGESSYEVFLDTLPGGGRPVFHVVALDGSRAASAISNPLQVPGGHPGLKPGIVVKVAPNTVYPLGMPVLLAADAFDPEDRGLPGSAIAWSSSVDGELGTGSELEVASLSAGTHTITAEVIDSDGRKATASVELVIDPSVVQPQPDPALEAAIGDIFSALASGDDPSGVSGGADAGLPPWLAFVFVAVLAGLGLGGTWLVRAQRAP